VRWRVGETESRVGQLSGDLRDVPAMGRRRLWTNNDRWINVRWHQVSHPAIPEMQAEHPPLAMGLGAPPSEIPTMVAAATPVEFTIRGEPARDLCTSQDRRTKAGALKSRNFPVAGIRCAEVDAPRRPGALVGGTALGRFRLFRPSCNSRRAERAWHRLQLRRPHVAFLADLLFFADVQAAGLGKGAGPGDEPAESQWCFGWVTQPLGDHGCQEVQGRSTVDAHRGAGWGK